MKCAHDHGQLLFDIKYDSFVWDTVQRRVLVADLNGAWRSEDELPRWQQVAFTEAYIPPEPLEAGMEIARDVYSLGVSFAILAV